MLLPSHCLLLSTLLLLYSRPIDSSSIEHQLQMQLQPEKSLASSSNQTYDKDKQQTLQQQQKNITHNIETRSSVNLTTIEEALLNEGYTNDQALECDTDPVDDLGEECSIIKYFNREIADGATAEAEGIKLTRHCACELANMQEKWIQSYLQPTEGDGDDDFERLVRIVNNVRHKRESPVFLWNDADISVYGISIYSATSDYFFRQKPKDKLRLPKELRQQLEREDVWRLVRTFCRKISEDPYNLFRYLENLNRINPTFFTKLLEYSLPIDQIFTAAKSCKLLVMLNYDQYQLRPIGQEYLPDFPIQVLNILRRTPNETSSLLNQVRSVNPFSGNLLRWSEADDTEERGDL